MEERVTIPTEEGHSLEGGFTPGSTPGGAVITHPHPLYSGSMDNNVVLAARAALENLQLSALRFNFRGVGASGGEHGGGKPEVGDIRAAVSFLTERMGLAPWHMVGYSFGSSVAVRAAMAGVQPATMTLISPPVDFMTFGHLTLPPVPTLVVVGERDDFCSVSSLGNWLEKSGASDILLHVVPHADHFYVGWDHLVKRHLIGFLREHIGG